MVSLDVTVQTNATVVIKITATEQAAIARRLDVYLDGRVLLAMKVCLIISLLI